MLLTLCVKIIYGIFYLLFWAFSFRLVIQMLLISTLIQTFFLRILQTLYPSPKMSCLNACFTSDHHTFCSLYKVRRNVIRCFNHDIAVGLCSELLMRFSYYINLWFSKKLLVHMGNEPRSFRIIVVKFTPRRER